jgi:hypothetical protein
MSAFESKADMAQAYRNARQWPKADVCPRIASMWGRVGVVLIVAVLAAVWVAAIYYFYWQPTPPSAFLPQPLGK